VAHVYATLFKTYFVPEAFQKRQSLLIFLPILCFVIGMILFSFGSLVFWSVLAYVAVFHFIRQQYGFMRLYSRKEVKTKWRTFYDALVIYTATGYPMLYWFFSTPRAFNWFTPHDFVKLEHQGILSVLGWVYALILVSYLVSTGYNYVKDQYFNIPKNAIIAGTFLSWYFGIVYFNNDLVFTLLNVVSHGIPYMALIYLNDIQKNTTNPYRFLGCLRGSRGVMLFIAFVLLIAFCEEYFWEILVWNDQFAVSSYDFSSWQFILVPLLTVPQFTHYLLDGFIWKSK
jgi:hypothetical protein